MQNISWFARTHMRSAALTVGIEFWRLRLKYFSLTLLLTLICCLGLCSGGQLPVWAQGLEVFVNNKPFSDKVIKYSGSIYAQAGALEQAVKGLHFDPGTGNYSFNGIILTPLHYDKPGSAPGPYLSLKTLAEISHGKYDYNPKTQILDVYTFSSEAVAADISRKVFSAGSISTEDNLQYLAGRIKEWLKTDLALDLGDYPIEVHLIEPSALLAASHNPRTMGYAQYQVQNRKILELKIYICRGLPLADAVHTTAHEIAHAWCGLHNCASKDIVEEEGFSEWVSYKVLKHFGFDPEADEILKNTDPVYGEGLRRILQREQQFGADWVLKYKQEDKGTLF